MSYYKKQITILYFGIFDQNAARNKAYIQGLWQNGYKILICSDKSKGYIKFWRLFRKHWALRHDYDVMIIGYAGHIIPAFARLITRKPIIFDALCSYYEIEIISRDTFRDMPFRIQYVRFVDWLATRCPDYILVETDRQRQYFIDELGVRADKLFTVYTGLDDSSFYFDPKVKKASKFTVLFRGRIMIEAGVPHILRAAKLLEDKGIDFLIIGYGCGQAAADFNAELARLDPKNVRHIGNHLPMEELRNLMLQCYVSLGQFEDNERLKRTVPHKAYESLAMKLPYVTARADGISEILTDGVDCLMVNPADQADLAAKILRLRDDSGLRERLAEAGYRLYQEKFTPSKVVEPIIELITRIA